MPQRTNISFNVLLSQEDADKLDQLAKHYECSKGLVIRQSVRNHWAMTIMRVPTCATGQRCPVPHIHATTPPGDGHPFQRPPRPQDPTVSTPAGHTPGDLIV